MAKSAFSGIFTLLVAVVVVGVLAAGGYYYWSHKADTSPEFTTVTVGRGELVQVATATGGLQAVTSVDVSSQISGLITEVDVDYNTPVKTGQVLARIDPATYKSRLQQAEAQLTNTQANQTLVRLNTERSRELRAKNLVAQQDLDQAEALLAQADAQVRIQTATVESARVDLARCTIYAPLDGIVIDRQAEVGKTVAASLNAPTLFTIVDDLAKMQIDAAVAEADVGSVDLKQPVNFNVAAFPGRQFRGTVTQIRNAPKTTSNVVTYDTIIDVNNADLKLRPGMTADVSIVVAQRPNALRVSNSALRVRIPDDVLEARKIETPKPADSGAAAPAKPLSDEELRTARREIFREAGFVFGSGPPSPEVLKKAQDLAKARGIELDFSRFGGGGRGGNTGVPAVTTRTVFVLQGTDPKTAKIAPTSVKLGISDGIYTEVVEGLKEGDVLVTGVAAPTASAAAATNNPFAQRPPMGGPGGGRR